MKKILVSLFAAVLLVGCSSSEGSTVCKVDKEIAGIDMEVEIKEKDSKLGELIFKAEDKNELYASAKDDEIKELKSYMEMAYENYEGVKVDVDIKGSIMTMKVILDVQKLDNIPSDFNVTGTDLSEIKDMKYKDFVKSLKDSGADCK